MDIDAFQQIVRDVSTQDCRQQFRGPVKKKVFGPRQQGLKIMGSTKG